MPPKRPPAEPADPVVSSSSDAPVEEKAEAKADAAALRKLAAHPSTAVMMKEALQELDSRKGVSSQAIQNYIKQKYPSVDLVRLKHLVRRALKKGIETGTLVRPANSSVTTGAMGKFRLAPKVKEPKPKTENTDPNAEKAPKPAKEGAKKAPSAGTTKKKVSSEQAKSQEAPKPSKKSKKNEEAPTSEVATSKAAPAKKPKSKKPAEKKEDEVVVVAAAKRKAAKAKETKSAKASQSKAAKAGSEGPASKVTGKREKKTE